MAASTTMPRVAPSTFTLTVPKADVSFFKTMAKKMGWMIEPRKATTKKARLYDPETGEYLNDKTMKAIEDVRSGKEPTYEFGSMEEFKAWCEASEKASDYLLPGITDTDL